MQVVGARQQRLRALDHGLIDHFALERKSAFPARLCLFRGGDQAAGMIERLRGWRKSAVEDGNDAGMYAACAIEPECARLIRTFLDRGEVAIVGDRAQKPE